MVGNWGQDRVVGGTAESLGVGEGDKKRKFASKRTDEENESDLAP
jgi:hypothetical protein